MKKVVVLVVLCALLVAGCGANVQSGDPPTQAPAPEPAATQPPEQAPAPTEEPAAPQVQLDTWNTAREGWPLFSDALTVEDAWYFGLATLYDLADETYNPEDVLQPYRHEYTVTMNTLQAALVGTSWCSADAATNQANLAVMEVSIAIDGEAVAPEFIHRDGYEEPEVGYCSDWTALTSDWPAGSYVVEVTYTMLAEVNDGFDVYPAGDYTDVFNITVDAQDPELGGIVFGSDREILAAMSSGEVAPLFALAAEEYSEEDYFQPGTLDYTVALPAGEPVLVVAGWCAVDWETLYANLEFIEPSMEFNGETIGTELRTALYFIPDQQPCVFSVALATSWPEGVHTVRTAVTLSDIVNDGERDYPAGVYEDIFTVTVSP